MGSEFKGQEGNVNYPGRRGLITAASNAAAPFKIDSNRRVQTQNHYRQLSWQLLTDADASDTLVTDYNYANMPTDRLAIDGVEKVWLAFCAEDTDDDDDFAVYIALWPHGNGTGFIAVRAVAILGTETHTGLMSTGVGDTTYYVSDDITIADQSVTATATNYTDGMSTLAVDTCGCKYISCQVRLDGGADPSADAMCFAMLPVNTN